MSWWDNLVSRFITGESRPEKTDNIEEGSSSGSDTADESPPLTNVLVLDPPERENSPKKQRHRRKRNGRIFELAVIEDRFVVWQVASPPNERVFILEDRGEVSFWVKPVNPYGFSCASSEDVTDSMFVGRVIHWSKSGPLPQLLNRKRRLVQQIHIPRNQNGSSREEHVNDGQCLALCAILEYMLLTSYRAGSLLETIRNGASAHGSHQPMIEVPRFATDQSRLEAALPNASSETAFSSAFSSAGGNSVKRRAAISTTNKRTPDVRNGAERDDDIEVKSRSTKREIKREKAKKAMKKRLREKDQRKKEIDPIANLPESKKRQAILSLWKAQGGIKDSMSLVGNASVSLINSKVQRRLDQRRIINGQRPSTASSSSSSSSEDEEGEEEEDSTSSSSSSSTSSRESNASSDSGESRIILASRKPRHMRETSDSEDHSEHSDSSTAEQAQSKKKRWRYAPGSANWIQRLFTNLVSHWAKLFSLNDAEAKMLTQWLECESEGWYIVDATMAALMPDQASLTHCGFGSPDCIDSRYLRREINSLARSPPLPPLSTTTVSVKPQPVPPEDETTPTILTLPSYENLDFNEMPTNLDQIETPSIFSDTPEVNKDAENGF